MSDQRIPRSCGLTLRTLRCRAGSSVEDWRLKLEPHTERFRGWAQFTNGVIKRAEHSQETLYWVFDAYAQLTGYPTGFIYLMSRLSSDVRDKKMHDVKKITKALRKLANYINKDAARLASMKGPDTNLKNKGYNEGNAKIAFDVVKSYQKGPVREGTRSVKYNNSEQQVIDARQVLILLEILDHVRPPFAGKLSQDR